MKPVKLPIGTAAGLVRITRNAEDKTPDATGRVHIHCLAHFYPDFGLVCTTDTGSKMFLLCRGDRMANLAKRLNTHGPDRNDEYEFRAQTVVLDHALQAELQAACPEEGILDCARVTSIQRTHASDRRKQPFKIAYISMLILGIVGVCIGGVKGGYVLYDLFFKPRTGDYHQITDGIGMVVGSIPASILFFGVAGVITVLASYMSDVYVS